MSNPRITVVIPTYNRARMVCGAIDSVLEQTFDDFELLVIDDGSTDDTAEVIEERYAGEPKVSLLRKANGGTGSARQHGLARARGDLLALLDSDDRYLPGFLESQAAFLDARPRIDLVLCDARFEGAWHHGWETVFSDPRRSSPVSLEGMGKLAWGLPSAIMMRTEAARRVGFQGDCHWSEDTDFLWRFHLAGLRLAENPEVLTSYVRHVGEDGEAQKIENEQAFDEDHLRMLESYHHHLPDSRNIQCVIHRLRAEQHLRNGERRRARRHYWQWWRLKPDSSKALKGLLRTLLPFG